MPCSPTFLEHIFMIHITICTKYLQYIKELVMSKPIQFQVGGVPEHFNLPWKKAIEESRFENQGISVSWQDYHGGTGAR